MNKKITLVFKVILLTSLYSLNAQTLSIITPSTPSQSTTIGGGNSLRVGIGAGNSLDSSSSNSNSFVGFQSALNTSTGSANTFLGNQTGYSNISGSANVFVGNAAGFYNKGSYNIFIGSQSGYSNNNGDGNIFVGHGSGLNNTSGGGNTFIGFSAGLNATGSGNVFIGSGTASNVTFGNDKLFIDNSPTSIPLIWGDFAADQLKLNGKVGIGAVTTFPTTAGSVNVSNYKLFVTGGILTDEVRVNLSSSGTWADYVFNKDYKLKPLSEVEKFISENGHLPNVPSAKQVKEEGIELGNMAKIQQEKIEELTLYLIQQNKEIEELKAQVKLLLNRKN